MSGEYHAGRNIRAGLFTLQTAGTEDELGEAAKLVPGVTSPPAPQPASLWTGSGSTRRLGSSRLGCVSRAGESARPGLQDKEGCLCRQMREYPRGDSEGERPPSVEWLSSELMVID